MKQLPGNEYRVPAGYTLWVDAEDSQHVMHKLCAMSADETHKVYFETLVELHAWKARFEDQEKIRAGKTAYYQDIQEMVKEGQLSASVADRILRSHYGFPDNTVIEWKKLSFLEEVCDVFDGAVSDD